jgi:hypothetical protein
MAKEQNSSRSAPSFELALAVGLLILGASCRTKLNPALDGFACDAKTEICVPEDAGVDAGDVADVGDGDAGADADAGGGGLFISAPTSSPTYTNARVTVQVSFDSRTTPPAQVSLFKDDTKLTDLLAPFSFEWDTTREPEGSYSLTARAQLGGPLVTSAPVTIIVDRTPPTVVLGSRAPAPGATEVVLAQPIQVAFSEPIVATSASTALTLAQASGAIATTATLAADGKVLTVTITDRSTVALSAAAPITLTASVSPTVTDLAGNAIASPPQWTWTVPLWLDYGTVRGESPSLALDSKGEPFVSTVFEPGAIGSHLYTMQVSHHVAGKSWDTSAGSPQTADALTAFAVTSIAVDSDDRPTVAWSEEPTGGPASSIHVARWSGPAWDTTFPPLDQVPGSSTDGFNPWLVFDGNKQLLAAWAEQGTNSVSDVYVARWTGSAWTQLPSVGAIGANSPVVIAKGGGAPIVSWTATVGMSGVSSWTGTAWATTNYPATYWSSMALTKAQRPIVAFVDGSSIRVRYVDANAEEFATATSGTAPRNPRIAIDSHDRAVVAWSDSDASGRNIRVQRWTGTEWDRNFGALGALPAMGTDAIGPAVAVDTADLPIIVWQELDPIRNATYVRKSNR